MQLVDGAVQVGHTCILPRDGSDTALVYGDGHSDQLVGKRCTEFPEGDFRAEFFRGDRKRQVADRMRAIVDDLGIEPGAIAETALRYVLLLDAVSTVIPRVRSVRNLERNCAVGTGAACRRSRSRSCAPIAGCATSATDARAAAILRGMRLSPEACR